MISKDTLKKVILEQRNQFKETYTPRDQLVKLNEKSKSDLIVIISGIRRCGKSVLLNEFKKTQKENDYYLNFDDERLISFDVGDFERLYEVFIELFGVQKTFYFDEIQNIGNWELFIRRLNDYQNKIYITGSNASLLSKELGTRLTGRHVQLELFPASFKEYLVFNNFKLSKGDLHTRERIVEIKKLFDKYLINGGFFKYLKTKDKDFFKALYDNIIYRDIVARYSLSYEKGLKDIFYYLLSNKSKPFSYATLKKVSGISSTSTIADYISYLENSYLLFTISLYDVSLKKQLINPKKGYVIDTALASTISFQFSEDKGRLLENVVFLELKRRRNEIYYHNVKYECDFIIKSGLKIIEAIQVCYDLNQENEDREIKGLLDAINTHNLKRGLILTYDIKEERVINGKKILVMPIWDWLLESY
ncbi:MAG: ATP-binding protein [Candidatus Woesearchaeota archaeon]